MKMKKFAAILLALVMVFGFAACAGGNDADGNNGGGLPSQGGTDEPQTPEASQKPNTSAVPSEEGDAGELPDNSADAAPEGSKILVAYFSATGSTEGIAQDLALGLGADLYEITPEVPYTSEDLDYGNSDSRSSVEMNDPSARPAISGTIANMEQYDVVFIGYPIWWGEAPRIMSTFIESYDFSGKTLVAFCTSASSGFGSSDSALRSAAGSAEWLTGHRFSAKAPASEVLAWADGLGTN